MMKFARLVCLLLVMAPVVTLCSQDKDKEKSI
jgi:hypothetical protein